MSTLKDLVNKLEPKYRNEALLFLAFLYKVDLSHMLAHLDKKPDLSKNKKIKIAFSRIKKDYPLAYLIGKKYFYGYPFLINKQTLIPRPESEIIIDLALDYAKTSRKDLKFIDIGTGPGTLIISLAKEVLKINKYQYQKAVFIAGDISNKALEIARKNAKNLKLDKKIIFKKSNLAQNFLNQIKKEKDKAIFISANLPYLNQKERTSEISIKYEPDLALIGGLKNGLLLYKKLLKQLKPVLDNQEYYLVMEINPYQAKELIATTKLNLPAAKIEKKSDLSGRTRFIVASYKN